MAKFDWDRETREARKRAHGSVPVWADPFAVSAHDERQVRQLLEPMVSVLDEYDALSRTQREQREGEFKFRLVGLKRDVASEAGKFANLTTREVARTRAELLLERFGALS
jgi:hypothetical protein